MSKKCCGIIYSENEKFCTMCGKSLSELPDIEDIKKQTAETENSGIKPEEATVVEEKSEETKTAEDKAEETNTEEGKNEETITVEEKTDESKVEKSEILDMAEVERIAASVEAKGTHTDESIEDDSQNKEADKKDSKEQLEEEDEEEDDDGTASTGLKIFGSFVILLMIASIVAVGLGVYFILLNPFYRNHDITTPVIYEEMSTDTDVTNIATRPALVEVSIAPETATDSVVEDATVTDATATDATDMDASEDME